MRRFISKVAGFTTLQLVLLSAVLWLGCRLPNSFLAKANFKHERLERAQGKRIILVGGSNIVQGVDSGLFEQHVPEATVISMSLTMALGLPFMLSEVKDSIREGDVVLLIPEYELLLNGEKVGVSHASFISEMILYRPQAAGVLSLPMAKAIADGGAVSLVGLVLRGFSWSMAKQSFKKKRRAPGNGMSGVFNEYGDAIWHRGLDPVPFNHFKLRGIDESLLQQTVEMLNAFQRHCAARGAKCVLNYPPLPTPSEEVKSLLSKLDHSLRAGLNFEVLQSPDASFYALDQFHNSFYHLDGESYPQRTKQLADALLPHL
jgi:hypothetical protein